MKILKRFITALWVIPVMIIMSVLWVILAIPIWVITGKDHITDVANNLFDSLILYVSEL